MNINQQDHASSTASVATGETSDGKPMPLAGVRVLDFGHMVMGPSCGLVLADLGAEVVRIEPVTGDPTRRLTGFAAGFFGFFNRNKSSLSVNLKSPAGMAVVHDLLRRSDVLLENFGPGTMSRLGLGWEEVQAINSWLIYCQLKGYLPGPYEDFMALDEVVQMQAGLAYMTGPKGMPLRAGSSVVDIGGGLFGVIGILAALHERQTTGKGSLIQSGLFETTAFLVGQHMASSAISGKPTQPMPSWRSEPKGGDGGQVSAWSIYQTLPTKDGAAFIGITNEPQWTRFCKSFEIEHVAADPRFATIGERQKHRPQMLALVAEMFAGMTTQDVVTRGRAANISAAPVGKPDDLFDDPHLNFDGGLAETRLRGEKLAKLPILPIAYNGQRLQLRQQPPDCGADNETILQSLGYDADRIEQLRSTGAVG